MGAGGVGGGSAHMRETTARGVREERELARSRGAHTEEESIDSRAGVGRAVRESRQSREESNCATL